MPSSGLNLIEVGARSPKRWPFAEFEQKMKGPYNFPPKNKGAVDRGSTSRPAAAARLFAAHQARACRMNRKPIPRGAPAFAETQREKLLELLRAAGVHGISHATSEPR